MLIIALIAGRGAEDPTISVVMMLTDCPSGLNSHCVTFTLGGGWARVCTSVLGQNRVGGRRRRGSKRVQKGWRVKQSPNEGSREIDKSHLQPCKEPSGDGQ